VNVIVENNGTVMWRPPTNPLVRCQQEEDDAITSCSLKSVTIIIIIIIITHSIPVVVAWWCRRRTRDQPVASSTPGHALPGDRPWAGKLSRYVTVHLGQLSLPSLRGR